MIPFDLDDVKAEIARRLSGDSFSHCERTAQTARLLARTHGADETRAAFAGLAHDIAGDLGGEDLLSRATASGIEITAVERDRPYLLHAQVGAAILEAELGITDLEILGAVRRHTLGDPSMTILDKIVYLADGIEPRRSFDGVEEIREMAARDIDAAFALAFKIQLMTLVDGWRVIDPRALSAWNHICLER